MEMGVNLEDGATWLFHKNIGSFEEAVRAVFHELLHRGIKALYPQTGHTPKRRSGCRRIRGRRRCAQMEGSLHDGRQKRNQALLTGGNLPNDGALAFEQAPACADLPTRSPAHAVLTTVAS